MRPLPHLDGHPSPQRAPGSRPYLTDGGLETSLVFLDGIDLSCFAAFPLVDSDSGRLALRRYYTPYLELAARTGAGIVLDTPTWRANLDWGARLGYDPERLVAVNRRAVELVAGLAAEAPAVTTVVNGVIGPRGDGYVVGATMTPSESASYHALQARAFAEAGAHMISAMTMTYPEEAIGIVRAAASVELPVVVSFTVETDGRLPSGLSIAEAIALVDLATDGAPAYYMLNCAHPTHFIDHIADAAGEASRAAPIARIKGIRANASRSSHAELDAATALDRGDVAELAAWYTRLSRRLDLRVVGGCCGTDHEHVTAIAEALRPASSEGAPHRQATITPHMKRPGSEEGHPMKTHIIPYAPEHADRIVELSLDAWAPVFASFEQILGAGLYRRVHPDWRTDQAAAVRAALDKNSTWVAVADGDVAGFVNVTFDDAALSGEIYMIAVDPRAQRRGIASALTEVAIDAMRARGLTLAIVATGGDPGHAPARATYEKAGFTGCPQVWYAKRID